MYANVKIESGGDTLACRACHAPAFNAHRMDPCGCVLCGRCTLLSQMNCICCNEIVVSQASDSFTTDALGRASFKCECGDSVSFSELRSHALRCSKMLFSCPNECGIFVSNECLKQHEEEECLKRLVSCEYCGLIVEADEIDTHLSKCGRMRIPCSNGCGEMICRGDFRMHNQECACAKETCQLCGTKYNAADSELHFGNLELLGRHLIGFMNEFRSSNEKVIQIYQDFSKRLARLEAAQQGDKSHTTTSLSDTIETPRIRTSLRVIPGGEQIGNERIGNSSLVLPLEFRIRNVYEVVTVPPVFDSFIEIKNIISNEIIKINPEKTLNQLAYNVSFTETGPFSIVLRADSGIELDRQDIEVLAQEFEVSNPNNIGECTQFCAAHQWLQAEPSRFFLVQSEGVEVYHFKIKRANTHVAFGFTESDNRELEKFTCCLSEGVCENGEFRRADHKFRANDDVVVRADCDEAILMLNGKQIYQFEGIEYQSFYVEVADAEVWLI